MEPTFTDVPGTPGVFCRGVLGLWVAQMEQGLHGDPGGQVANSGVWLLDLGDRVDPCQDLRGGKSTQHLPLSPAFSPLLAPLPLYLQLPGQKRGKYKARTVTELHGGSEKVGLKVSGVARGSGDTHNLPAYQPVNQRGLAHIGET